jgi:hypothetical protein
MRLAFIGQQRSGKDTAGEIYASWMRRRFFRNGYEGEHYALADPLKDLVESAYGNVQRAPCQAIGKALREFDDDIWCEILRRQLIEDSPQWAYVTDVRYANEVAMLSKQGFKMVGISAPDEERYLRSCVTPDEWAVHEKHESESSARATLLDAPYVVKNDGNIATFRKKLEELFEVLYADKG